MLPTQERTATCTFHSKPKSKNIPPQGKVNQIKSHQEPRKVDIKMTVPPMTNADSKPKPRATSASLVLKYRD